MNKTPLHIAIEKISKEIVELLITNSAEINVKDTLYHIIV